MWWFAQRASRRDAGPPRRSAVVRVLHVARLDHVANVSSVGLRPAGHMSVSSQRTGRRQRRQVNDTPRSSLLRLCILARTTKVIRQKAESLSQVHATRRLYLPGSSVGLTVWQFRRLSTPKSPVPLGGQGPPSNTMYHWTPQMASESVERFKQGARM